MTEPPIEVPPHVPAELVRPISLAFSPEFLADPYGMFRHMHDDYPPVFWSPAIGPAAPTWMLTKHADCFHVLRHPELFTNVGGTPFPRDPDDHFFFIPVEIEPPHHRKYRNILDPFFSPQGILRLENEVRDLASSLVDQIADKGHCEFTTEFSRPLPVSVFLGLMGLPQDMRDTFVGWVAKLLHSQDPKAILEATNTIGDYLKGVIEEKRKTPDDRALSAIVHARIDGEPLTFKEIFGFAFFVFIAGIDTVYATLNNAFLWLAQNPQRRREILESPDNMAGIVEELHRANTVTFSGRTATQDVELRGVSIKAGEKVLCVLPAANYDPEVFPDPRDINFHRPRTPILAFSGGAHSCMGAHLARLEMKLCLEEFLRRIPDFKVKPGAQMHYLPGGVIGPNCLPLVW
jgi:cytochrome P450